MTFGCPIAAEQTEHVPFFSQRRAKKGKESAEAMTPVGEEGQMAQEQITSSAVQTCQRTALAVFQRPLSLGLVEIK
jgi:hypothetical protein